MATTHTTLSPRADTTPAIVRISASEFSGLDWVQRFPGSALVSDCVDPFKGNLSSFLSSLNTSGANVSIAATYRPAERAYLMHWSWMIAKKGADPQTIPARVGVGIRWDHVE
jgi:hypothetical protein